jgi:hypothetical protein
MGCATPQIAGPINYVIVELTSAKAARRLPKLRPWRRLPRRTTRSGEKFHQKDAAVLAGPPPGCFVGSKDRFCLNFSL